MISFFVTVTLIVTAFLFLLNVIFAIVRRNKRSAEVASYIAAAIIELAVFIVVLLFRLGTIKIPFSLPRNLSFNRAEIAAVLSFGLGLFPAAYWQRTSWAQMRKRMEDDAKVIKQRDGGVRVRAPGEWIN